MFVPASPGLSKLGAEANATVAVVPETVHVNSALSVPATEHARVPDVSVSVIEIEATVAVFSATVYVSVTVAAGVWSLTSVIVIAVVCAASVLVPVSYTHLTLPTILLV